MLMDYNDWKSHWEKFANKINANFEIHRYHNGRGFMYKTIITTKQGLYPVLISQGTGGSDREVGQGEHLELNYINSNRIQYDISLYKKDFLDKLFKSGKIKTGNPEFDKKFGIYTTNNETTKRLFNNIQIQTIFLNNKFLVFNVQKKESKVTLKSMKRTLYQHSELKKLLDDFVYILKVLTND